MKRSMQRFLWVTLASLAWAASGELGNVKTVYILPMAGGLDQHLASMLTSGGDLQVVTDPRGADAIFTEHIGAGFEQSMDDLYGVKETAKSSDGDKGFARVGGSGRGKGTVFLVDRKSRGVIWSTYLPPKSMQPDDVHKAAEKIASMLQKD